MSYAHSTNQLPIVCVLASKREKWFCANVALNGIIKSASTLNLKKLKIGLFVNTA